MIRIEDYPYFITEAGDVFREGSSKPLTQVVHKDTGYLMVSLWKNNKPTTRYVHILTATYYVTNQDPVNKLFVNHKDGNKQNPHKDNLEWTTRSENMLHAYRIGLCSQAHRKVLTEEQAEVALATILDGTSLTKLADFFGIGLSTLHRYVNKAAEKTNQALSLRAEYRRQKAIRNKQANQSKKVCVIQCDLSGKPIKVFESLQDAGRELGINSGNISNCLKGRAKTCGGYTWKYK